MTAATDSTQRTHSPNPVIANGPEASSSCRLPLHAGIAAVALLALFAISGPQQLRAQAYSVLYSFTGSSGDGANPSGGIIRDASGNLYGATRNGGSFGNGAIFKVDPTGNEVVLHSFAGGSSDGAQPLEERLAIDSAGNLYGTTLSGGPGGGGIVFKLDPSGNETILHGFSFSGSDGSLPVAGVIIDSAGNLYGTTDGGGAFSNSGTVFKVDPSGNETVLHSFDFLDGAHPEAGLIRDSAGNLYGTTRDGGTGNNGTVFKVDTAGNETVLYSFTGGNDGAAPEGGVVIDASGNLYGTTSEGGAAGDGVVFKVNPAGNETVLHSFTGGNDGAAPYSASLIMDSAGNIYGTTAAGGSSGDGTVFKVDSSGNETVLHAFTGSPGDGAIPGGALALDSSRNLYGDTASGGSSGNGIVFKLALPVPFAAFNAKLDITSGPPAGFDLTANFTQGSGAPAINPVTQNTTLSVGTYTVTIPSGSFQNTSQGRWVYDGTIGGVALQARISQTGANSYSVQVDASGVDLTKLTNPVTVTLTIGQNSGTTQVTAGF